MTNDAPFVIPNSYLVNPMPLSYLNQLLYCPRRFWYMYVHGELEINAPMLEGTIQHATRVDQPGRETDDQGCTIYRRQWVWSDTLNIAGFADLIEERTKDELRGTNDNPFVIPNSYFVPVEYKHGRVGQWDNDQVQLCAQALCLEEMTHTTIPHGEIFYWRSRRRTTVPFDPQLRQLTHNTIQRAFDLIAADQLPPPLTGPEAAQKCQHCSIQPICLPQEVQKLRSTKYAPS